MYVYLFGTIEETSKSKTLNYISLLIFTFINSVYPDEMQHGAAFHLGLHCLQKYSFRGFPKVDCNCSH